MKTTSTKVLSLAPFLGVIAFATVVFLAPVPKTYAVTEPLVCKVEIIDCPGIGTGDKQACISTGAGVTCATCGESTKCPTVTPTTGG